MSNDGTLLSWGSSGFSAAQKPQVSFIANGQNHTLELYKNGSVWASGDNFFGQLGDASNTDRGDPVKVSGISNVQAIAAGTSHSVALLANGTVWTWGRNSEGQLGDGGSTLQSNVPVQVSVISDVQLIASGLGHVLALLGDGTVWAWGDNSSGQLGDGTMIGRDLPVKVQNLNNVTGIAAGGFHSLSLLNGGNVWAWGKNFTGQLGDNTTIDRSTPVQVQGLNTIQAITAGAEHSLALFNNCTPGGGTIWVWGDNVIG